MFGDKLLAKLTWTPRIIIVTACARAHTHTHKQLLAITISPTSVEFRTSGSGEVCYLPATREHNRNGSCTSSRDTTNLFSELDSERARERERTSSCGQFFSGKLERGQVRLSGWSFSPLEAISQRQSTSSSHTWALMLWPTIGLLAVLVAVFPLWGASNKQASTRIPCCIIGERFTARARSRTHTHTRSYYLGRARDSLLPMATSNFRLLESSCLCSNFSRFISSSTILRTILQLHLPPQKVHTYSRLYAHSSLEILRRSLLNLQLAPVRSSH